MATKQAPVSPCHEDFSSLPQRVGTGLNCVVLEISQQNKLVFSHQKKRVEASHDYWLFGYTYSYPTAKDVSRVL